MITVSQSPISRFVNPRQHLPPTILSRCYDSDSSQDLRNHYAANLEIRWRNDPDAAVFKSVCMEATRRLHAGLMALK